MNWNTILSDKQILSMIKMKDATRLGKKLQVRNCCPSIREIRPNKIGQICKILNSTTPEYHREVWVCVRLNKNLDSNIMRKVLFSPRFLKTKEKK